MATVLITCRFNNKILDDHFLVHKDCMIMMFYVPLQCTGTKKWSSKISLNRLVISTLVFRTPAFHAENQGSNPAGGNKLLCFFISTFHLIFLGFKGHKNSFSLHILTIKPRLKLRLLSILIWSLLYFHLSSTVLWHISSHKGNLINRPYLIKKTTRREKVVRGCQNLKFWGNIVYGRPLS